jgi:hypothetical protein
MPGFYGASALLLTLFTKCLEGVFSEVPALVLVAHVVFYGTHGRITEQISKARALAFEKGKPAVRRGRKAYGPLARDSRAPERRLETLPIR